MAALTPEITDDVLDVMKKLVYSIMKGMGTSSVEAVTAAAVGERDGALCMWCSRSAANSGVGGETRPNLAGDDGGALLTAKLDP